MSGRLPRYSFDTSAFIDTWRRLYPPATFRSLWKQMATLVGSGAVIASHSVLLDLKKRPDELLEWVELHASGVFIADGSGPQPGMRKILAHHPNLVSTTHGPSDPLVIAHAIITNTTVVTQESKRSLVNPKIPDVCGALNVHCITPLQLMMAEGWTF